MAITREDFIRQTRQRFVAEATPEARLQGLTPEQMTQALPLEQKLRGIAQSDLQLTPEQIALLDQIRRKASPPAAP